MGTGYTRQSAASMIDGQVIYADDHNAEFNLLEAAFSGNSGHSHDGTLGEGPLISLTTSVQGVLPVLNGGTGSTTAEGARTNLGLGSLSTKSGPGSSADNSIVRFDGITGNIQGSSVVIDDSGNLILDNKAISGLANGTDNSHAVNLSQLSSAVEGLEEALEDAVEDLQEQILEGNDQIGDFKDTARTLDSRWLRRNGAAYSSATYPDLAEYFTPLPSGIIWEDYDPVGIEVFLEPTRLSNGDLAVVGGNYYQRSDDWDEMTPRAQYRTGTSQAYTFTEYGNGVYVICSSGGGPGPSAASGSYISVDGGLSFSPTGYPDDVPVNGLTWFNDMFVAFCIDDQSVHTSADGVTWDRHSTGWVGSNWAGYAKHVVVGNEIFVVNSVNDYFIWSSDGETWTNATNAHICNDITYSNGWFVTVGPNGEIKRTDNFKTGSWTTISSGTTKTLFSIEQNGGTLVIVGDGITLMSSNDGAGWVSTATEETGMMRKVIKYKNSTNGFVTFITGQLLLGELSSSPLFRVPNDNPTYGWIRALD